MKLYYAPGACSLADHIALHEAGLSFEHVKVDLKTHRTKQGDDYKAINPKGYVPALTLDSGETITENIAILDWIAHQRAELRPEGALGHTRLLEALAFISTELHKSFSPFFQGAGDPEKDAAKEKIGKRFALIEQNLDDAWLLGDRFTVADAYLLVMLLWARKNDVPVPAKLTAYAERVQQRDAVRTAMSHEGLI